MIPRWFIRFILAWLNFDLVVARSTGRSPSNVAAIAGAINEWELLLWQKEWSLK